MSYNSKPNANAYLPYRNNGYYYFRPEFISYQADTIMNPGKVALRISTKPGLPRTVLRPWKIGDISVFLNGYNNEPPTDSIRYKDMTIFYEGKLRIRPKVLYDRLKFRPGDLYSQQQQEKTGPASPVSAFSVIRKCNISPKIPPAVAIR